MGGPCGVRLCCSGAEISDVDGLDRIALRDRVSRKFLSYELPVGALLDEPSAGMTHREMHELMDNLLEFKRQADDLTIVLIEHEMKIIERVTDRCAVLNFGRKICEGSYAQVVANPEVQEAYLGTNAKSVMA